eukprot:CCRYP_018051-RA/>CCRYP_018051-RA protein AED:0.41 eAED:0.47 QI:0/0/0/1/0/0/2/0/90
MYWKGMCRTIRAYVQNLVVTYPWEALCVDLIGPYTPKGRDRTIFDFICLTMIDPATSWFKIIELPAEELKEHSVPWVQRGVWAKRHMTRC